MSDSIAAVFNNFLLSKHTSRILKVRNRIASVHLQSIIRLGNYKYLQIHNIDIFIHKPNTLYMILLSNEFSDTITVC